ncbi:MAG: vWA domain-containing protein [Burkholderiaceae bacterium]
MVTATGALAHNLVLFARLLRTCGLRLGTDRLLLAQEAVGSIGLDSREAVRAALRCTLTQSHEDQPIFDAAFEAFWKDPRWLDRAFAQGLGGPAPSGDADPAKNDPLTRRVQSALEALMAQGREPSEAPADKRQDTERVLGWSHQHGLRSKDFEGLGAEELQEACRLARALVPAFEPVRLRRFAPATQGRLDLRRSLARWHRTPDVPPLVYRSPRERAPGLAVLLDVSGSMTSYSRVLLHWCHGLVHRPGQRIEVFALGTELHRLTPALQEPDPDRALRQAQAGMPGWGGGTRLGPCLQAFSRDWARRVLQHRSVLLLVTDGLDRGDPAWVAAGAQRLSRQAHQLVWLNPLLRFAGFEPRAAGIRALLPHVDRHLPVHNLNSLADLAQAFSSDRRSVKTNRTQSLPN